MKKALVITGVLGLVLSGCAHSAMRGSVAMKTSENEAHVCMDKSEAKVGEKVRLFTSKCAPKGSPKTKDGSYCEKVYLGDGVVTANLNDHYSVVKFDDGVKFEEGTFVETF